MQIKGHVRKHVHAGIRLALHEPDMAPNVGAILRLGACLGVPVDVIEPCGFAFSPRAWRRQAMDYAELAEIHRHDSWQDFLAARSPGRLVAMTTRGSESLWDFAFRRGDTLLLGSEGAGLPEAAHAMAEARVAIPLMPGARSLNLATAAAIAAAEALRQLAGALPDGYAFRRGRAADIPRLRQIEADGARLYATVGYDFCVGGAVRDPEEHMRGLESGALLVIDDSSRLPVAFALLWIVDGHAHLTELSVALNHQGRGLGRALLAAAERWAAAGAFTEITLTCFTEVPWNEPLYRRLGWERFEPEPDRPGLAVVIAEEAAAGYAVRPRVPMRKRLR